MNEVPLTYSLIDRKNKIIMGWSPKAGSAVACKMFFEHMGLLQEALEYGDFAHNYREKIFYSKFGRSTIEELHNPNYLKFKVIRNPYARIISTFLHTQFLKIRRQPAGKDESFFEFIIRKDRDISETVHLVPQKGSYESKETFHLIRLENFVEEIEKLNAKFNTKFNPHHVSRHHVTKTTKSHGFVGKTKYSQLVEKNVIPPRTSPPYDNFYNEEIKDMVYEMYKKDIDFYEYDFPFESLAKD